MNLYITRHGQTDWNVEGMVQGKADIELNETGMEQAKETYKKLLEIPIDLIICSPLIRARQTAEIINKDRNIPIEFDERISERDFGELEGLNKADFDFQGFWSYKRNIQYEKAENIKAFFNRIYTFLDELKSKSIDKNILLVTHGGVSIPVNCYFLGIPEDDDLLKLVLKNCEVKKFKLK